MTAADGAALTHKNGYLTVTLAPGWQGSVQVRWTGMWFWRAADCISLLALQPLLCCTAKAKRTQHTFNCLNYTGLVAPKRGWRPGLFY